MWTHHNPYTTDKRFHQTPPTPEEIKEGVEWIRERRQYIQQLMKEKLTRK